MSDRRPDSEARHDVLFLGRQLEWDEWALEQEREALRDGYYIVKHLLDSWEEGVPFGTTLNVIRDAESAMREALASSPGAAAHDLLTRDEKISLRTAVGCLAEDYPHAAGLPHAESALRKLRATQADTDEP